MPTWRAAVFLLTAFLLYLFANQTQVGWLYVMAALLSAVVLAAGLRGWRALHGISASRALQRACDGSPAGEDLYEGDCLSIGLRLADARRAARFGVHFTEACPLEAPDSPSRQMEGYIPYIPADGTAQLDYNVTLYRRGAYHFPALKLRTRHPFGFFQRRLVLDEPTRLLVYPELQPLNRLDLLNRRLQPELPAPRPGHGSEFLGVRPYRQGDSPRHIHWRSSARRGALVSKEFADEAQPGLSLVLDLYAHPYPELESKHNPFEWAVKLAASLGDFALRHGYPLHLVADEQAWPIPRGPLTQAALFAWLARVEPVGRRPIEQVLGAARLQPFTALVLPWPVRAEAYAALFAAGRVSRLLAAQIDPATFPRPGPSAMPAYQALAASGIETRLVRYDPDPARHGAAQLEGRARVVGEASEP